MLELLNQLDGFDSRGDVKVWSIVIRNYCLVLHSLCINDKLQTHLLTLILKLCFILRK